MTLEDPLSVFLLAQARIDRASCVRSLHSLFQGVSGYSVGTLLATFDHSSPISSVKTWKVATSFSGAGTFGSHLRRYGHPYVLVAASETQDYHRAAHEANHPGLEVFAHCVSEPSVTRDIPAHHLRFCGFPCVSYSRLNRRVDDMILSSSLVLFEAFLASFRHQPPPVILLECSVHLLSNEPNNEKPAHCKRLIVNNEGNWAHCCNSDPPGLTMRLIVATMRLIVAIMPPLLTISYLIVTLR